MGILSERPGVGNGLVGVLILIILVVLFGSISAIRNNGRCGFWDEAPSFKLCFGLPYAILTFPTIVLGINLSHAFWSHGVDESTPSLMSELISFLFTYLGGILIWFLGGAFVGWIVRKTKSNRSK